MYCSKCGSFNNEGTAFCGNCGNQLSAVQANAQNYGGQPYVMNSPQQSFNQANYAQSSTVNSKDALVDAYIGKNVVKIRSKKFSWPTFLFGVPYAFYRKMWGLGLLWMLLSVIPLSPLILAIVFGVKFNEMYLKKVNERVDKIVSENPGKSKEELQRICTQKGGTALGLVILIYVFIVAIITGLMILATFMTNEVVDDARASAAKTEAAMIVSGVNNFCLSQQLKEQMTGAKNICADGITKSEISQMVDLGNAEVIDIEYNEKITYLKVKTNNILVEYDGTNYKFSK